MTNRFCGRLAEKACSSLEMVTFSPQDPLPNSPNIHVATTTPPGITENFRPTDPANRVDVEGTVSGIGDTEQVALLIYPADAACPIISAAAATVDGSSFTARGDFGDQREFRFVLVAHAGVLDDVSCDDASGCLSTAAGSFSAVSHAIEVRLAD